VPSAQVIDIAGVLIGNRPIKTVVTGIRPGEKIHEILVSEEEAHRTVERGEYYAIMPMLPELRLPKVTAKTLEEEYSSADNIMAKAKLANLLKKYKLLIEDKAVFEEELLA
jgi:UDP-glucose 4-epimerase